jgi:hypothetical protein
MYVPAKNLILKFPFVPKLLKQAKKTTSYRRVTCLSLHFKLDLCKFRQMMVKLTCLHAQGYLFCGDRFRSKKDHFYVMLVAFLN